MKYTVQLDKQDIANIIARYFSVDSAQVNIEINTTTEGYEMTEHEVKYVEAKVVFDKQVAKFPF